VNFSCFGYHPDVESRLTLYEKWVLGDAVLVQTVLDVCKKNAEKTIDEATTIAIASLPVTEVKKPGEIK
jgi:hypothetical protein